MSEATKPGPFESMDLLAPSPSSRLRAATMAALDVARRRLGGRAIKASERAPGGLVAARLLDGERHAGVLLWASDGSCDVWFDDGLARRTRADALVSLARPAPEALVRVEAEIRIFASMIEGDRVRWQRDAGIAEGRIAEKCRYGAIVATRGGRAVAVGFRKLWPCSVPVLA
jgi:hypothetical protein